MACFMSLRDVGPRCVAWLMTCDPIHGSNRSGVEVSYAKATCFALPCDRPRMT
jgi:hypothetical protein